MTAASNQQAYASGRSNVETSFSWPKPIEELKLRCYKLDEYDFDNTFRIFRSQNLMLNILIPRAEARDTKTMTPHFLDKFEQGWIRNNAEYPMPASVRACAQD